MMEDKELLELAAKAAGLEFSYKNEFAGGKIKTGDCTVWWTPLHDDGDRYRLARTLGISIDFEDCCAWKRLPSGSLIQEYWGGECGDEANAIVRVAAEIGRTK